MCSAVGNRYNRRDVYDIEPVDICTRTEKIYPHTSTVPELARFDCPHYRGCTDDFRCDNHLRRLKWIVPIVVKSKTSWHFLGGIKMLNIRLQIRIIAVLMCGIVFSWVLIF